MLEHKLKEVYQFFGEFWFTGHPFYGVIRIIDDEITRVLAYLGKSL